MRHQPNDPANTAPQHRTVVHPVVHLLDRLPQRHLDPHQVGIREVSADDLFEADPRVGVGEEPGFAAVAGAIAVGASTKVSEMFVFGHVGLSSVVGGGIGGVG